MDSEQKSAVTRAPGDSRDNGKMERECFKVHKNAYYMNI